MNEYLQEQLKFIDDYKRSSNAATGSKYDSNANVTGKNIATLATELDKKNHIDLQRAVMKKYITALGGGELAKQYEADLAHHIIYRHDETSGAGGFPYCVAISLYPFLTDGLTKVGGNSLAPQHADSFVGGFVNLLYIVAAQYVGALAVPETLTYLDHFLRKDYGDDYYLHLDKAVEYRVNGDISLQKRIENWFAQLVYTINQPAAARGNQSIFFNIAYFDKYYFASIFDGFVFPDGDEPCWESTQALQKMFMEWLNNERLKNVITFPVETVNLLVQDGKYADEDTANWAADMWSKGASFFCYQSDSVDALSSCCFEGSQLVLTRNSETHVRFLPIKTLYEKSYREVGKNFKVYHNGGWKKAKCIQLPARPLFKVTTSNKKTIIVTDNHINPTLRGDIETSQLTTDDYLMFSTLPVDAIVEQDQHLTYEQGYLIGLFAGDGSITERQDCNSCDITWSLNHQKNDKSLPILQKALQQLRIECSLKEYEGANNVYFIKSFSRELEQFIHTWINSGHAYDKAFNLRIIEQSIAFRRGILDGYYDSDGGNSNRIYSISKSLIYGMEAICTSLGIQTIIDISDRTNEKVVIRGEEYTRNYPLYCLRWYDRHNKRSMGDSWKVVNNSIYFRITNIEPYESDDPYVYCFEVDDENEPYFTLPNGIITHNCRLKNVVEHEPFSYTLGAGGIMTGSKAVISLNLNRIVQDWKRENDKALVPAEEITLRDYITPIVCRVHKYLEAFNNKLWDDYNADLLTIFKAGFIELDKQYLTVGVNGIVEAAEFLDIPAHYSDKRYQRLAVDLLGTIEALNQEHRSKHCKYNLEFVPGESMAVKFAAWDRRDGYSSPRETYNSYFYRVEDDINAIDRFYYQGKGFADVCSGGVALHNNLHDHLSATQYRMLMDVAVKAGCNYFTYNIPNTICNECGYISKHMLEECPKCHSTNLDYITRIIGYIKRISNFSEARQREAAKRHYS